MNTELTRRAFLAGSGTVLASLGVTLASGPARAFAEEPELVPELTAQEGEGSEQKSGIAILSTNDVHCELESKKTGLGYAKLRDFVAARKTAYGEDNVLLVDAGDNVQGGVVGSLTQGESPAKAIKACRYDFMTCGNHEFDYGMEKFFELRKTEGAVAGDSAEAGVRYVCCNFVDVNGNRVFDAYRVKECKVAGQTVRIAFVGAATPSSLTSSMPKSFKDKDGNYIYGFCGDESGQGLYDAVQAAVDEARSASGGDADYVVLLGHLGQRGSQDRWRSDQVVAHTHGIDVVIDGHSHEMYVQTEVKNDRGENVVITQTGTKFQSFGSLVIDPFTGEAEVSLTATGVSAELIEQWDGSDAEVAALVAELEDELDQITSQEVGSSEVFLRAQEDDGVTWRVRKAETNLGDLVADAFFYHAANCGKACDVALVNGGGVRANVDKGALTYGDLVAVCSFNNQVCSLEVPGQHLLDMLEVGVSRSPEAHGRFLQVSEGFSMVVRTDIDSPVRFSADDSKIEGIEGERRVRRARLYGKAIDPAATYTVVSTDYLLVLGGNAMPVPQNADKVEFMGTDIEALLDYVKTNLRGTVDSRYSNEDGEGRITIKSSWGPEDEEEDAGDGDGDSSGDGSGDGDGSGGSGAQTSGAGARKSHIGVPATGDEGLAAAAAAAAVLGAGAIAASGVLID